MMIVDQLVVQHQTLRNKTAENAAAVDMNEIMAFMDQVQAASAHVENPPQREQLQAILFHWNGYVHNVTGTYPGVQLAPFSPLPAPATPDAAEGERTARVTTTVRCAYTAGICWARPSPPPSPRCRRASSPTPCTPTFSRPARRTRRSPIRWSGCGTDASTRHAASGRCSAGRR